MMKQIQSTAYSPKDEDIEEGRYHISPGIIGGSPKWGDQFIDLQKHKEKKPTSFNNNVCKGDPSSFKCKFADWLQ
jgi:hypothetical protein